MDLPELIVKGEELTIPIKTKDASRLQYFLTNSEGKIVESGVKQITGIETILALSKEKTKQFLEGANDLKVFAMSDEVLRPDIYRTSFLVVANPSQEVPEPTFSETPQNSIPTTNYGIFIIIGGAIGIGILLYVKNKLDSKKRDK